MSYGQVDDDDRNNERAARMSGFRDPEDVQQALQAVTYFADEGLATAIFLAGELGKPLLLEGEPGVGKTAVAHALAGITGRELVRLQCYEGLDAAQSLYEWNYARQLLHLRAHEHGADIGDIYRPEFLLERPLLRALRSETGSVLLIDEVDRADAEFEAYLLEFLSDFQISIPEMGTVSATVRPLVILTSNRTREVHDALKRRCLYHWLEHPALGREVAILRRRLPEVSERLATQVASAVRRLREMELLKPPGVAESLDWAQALVALGRSELDAASAAATLGAVLKYREDSQRVVAAGLDAILAG